MNKPIRFKLKDLAGTDVLAGSAAGRLFLSKVVEALPRTASAEPVALDFRDIRVATGSFLREAVIALRDYCRSSHPQLYPVIANADEGIREELDLLLKAKNDVCVVCNLNEVGRFSQAQLLGTLEDKQSITLKAVLEHGEADASELFNKFKAEKISITGWNNRLAALAAKGILTELKQGKGKLYKPVLEGINYGR